MMDCINFDKQFERYAAAWVKRNGAKYKNNMDVIEGMMPDIYMEFLRKPADWLDGKRPGRYFEQYSDAGMLVKWMCRYIDEKVPLPDLLLERITALGAAAEEALCPLAQQGEGEKRMTAISLLRELESVRPMSAYVDYIAALKEPDEVGDMCAESLTAMGEAAVGPILEALPGATDTARDIFADVLSNFPGDERIFELIMERFEHAEDKRALFASYLAKLGDERALSALYAAAQERDVNYLDYVEIVSAIDALGGDRPPEREFAGDPYYESMKQLG